MALQLKQEYCEAILKDKSLQGKIADDAKRGFLTIYRWAIANDERLTMESVQKIIREHLKIPLKIILTEQATEKV